MTDDNQLLRDKTNTIAKLEEQRARQQKVVDTLRAGGHECGDAERQLQRYEVALTFLK